MFEVTRVSAEVGGNEISFETGKLAKQASGAVVVRAGDTMVLCTATAGNDRDVDFLPLTVDVEERHYAAGKIPGSFFRREATSGREGDAYRAHDRPPVRAAVPEGLAPRDPAGVHADVGGPRPPLRHPRHERRLRRPGDLRDPRRHPRRRGSGRQARRRLRRQPRGGDPRGARARPDRLRLRRGDPDGRGRRLRRLRAGDPGCARHRAHRDQEAGRHLPGAPGQGRQGEDRDRGAQGRRGADRVHQGLARRQARRGHPDPGQARAPGRHRRRRGRGARAVRPRRRRRGGRPRAQAARSRPRSRRSRRT